MSNDFKEMAMAATATKAKPSPGEFLAQQFDRRMDQFQRVLPNVASLDLERLKELVCIAYTAPGSQIAGCTPASVLMAARDALALGLDPVTKALGQAWLVPYSRKVGDKWIKEAQFQVGHRGYPVLAERTGRISRMVAQAVYQAELDEFYCDQATGELRHPWRPGVERTGDNLVAAYCAVWLQNPRTGVEAKAPVIRILDRDQIEARRMRNPAERKGRHSPWQTDYVAMSVKCPVRALFGSGMIPLSSDQMQAVAIDAELDEGVPLGQSDYTISDTEEVQEPAQEEAPALIETEEDPTEIDGITADMVSEEEWAAMVKDRKRPS